MSLAVHFLSISQHLDFCIGLINLIYGFSLITLVMVFDLINSFAFIVLLQIETANSSVVSF